MHLGGPSNTLPTICNSRAVQIPPKAGNHAYTGSTWQFGICEALQNSYETFRLYTKAFWVVYKDLW